jgi:hypothetical protein
MKTVYDRLSEDAKQKLQAAQDEIPYTVDSIISEFKRYEFFIQVPYGAAMDFKRVTGIELSLAVESIQTTSN